jgi:carboxyl-terminal processing protease
LPIAVLVDSESASASEIFAAAIQDHHRGRVVGTRTYGKGSVQSIFPLTLAGTGLRLTTAHFFSPKGKRLQGVGVEPDLSVVRGEDEMGQELPVPRVPTLENDPQLRLAAEQIGQTLAVRSAN